jgi:predicted nucleic acid-binding protein
MSGLVLDAGALIALEREHRPALLLVKRALGGSSRIVVPATALAQVARDLRRQVRLARLLRHSSCVVSPLDRAAGLRVGRLLAESGTKDVVDAHVVAVAQALGLAVLTSDVADLRALDPDVVLVPV